jgi:hypothetical protein
MAPNAEWYRQKSEECEARAKESYSPQARAYYQAMAEHWRTLALLGERRTHQEITGLKTGATAKALRMISRS